MSIGSVENEEMNKRAPGLAEDGGIDIIRSSCCSLFVVFASIDQRRPVDYGPAGLYRILNSIVIRHRIAGFIKNKYVER